MPDVHDHVCRESVDIDKRLLIRGEGRLGETQIDQRANSPTFRIQRTCVIHNLDLDMTGFRECLFVGGSVSVHPLVSSCKIRFVPCLPGNLHLKSPDWNLASVFQSYSVSKPARCDPAASHLWQREICHAMLVHWQDDVVDSMAQPLLQNLSMAWYWAGAVGAMPST